MKTTLCTLGAVTALSITTLMQQANAQSITTPVTYAGTVSAFSPEVITVRGTGEPVAYRYTKSTTYVDEAGVPVSVETVRSGLPVTVYYTREGNDVIASKVVVRRTVTTTTHDD